MTNKPISASATASTCGQWRSSTPSPRWTFWLYTGLGVLAVIFFSIKVPETKNRSLEEIERDIEASRDPAGPDTREKRRPERLRRTQAQRFLPIPDRRWVRRKLVSRL